MIKLTRAVSFTRAITTCLLLSLVGACGGGGGGGSSSGTDGANALPSGGLPSGWPLVWSDEFDAAGLPDVSKWEYDISRNAVGWYNNELQYYGNARLENSSIANGKLSITALHESLNTLPDWGGQAYSSARLVTRGKASWTYGFFEIRAKLPCGLGTWPAIWMLGTGGAWPDDGELDIMEHVGKNKGVVLGTVHTGWYNGGNGLQRGGSTTVADACDAFHNYQLTWTHDKVVFGVDNTNYFQYTNPGTGYGAWPFDKPQYLLLNLAIGGTLGGSVDNSIFPAKMEIEYVRVYQAPAS